MEILNHHQVCMLEEAFADMLITYSSISDKKAGWADELMKRIEKYNDTPLYDTIGSTAVITIKNIIFKEYSLMCYYMNGTSSDRVSKAIMQANRDEECDSILLNINSPGGYVSGTPSTGSVISQSQKPIFAYVNTMAASAAYWLASQANRIILSEDTAMVGSIGVINTHYDYSKRFEELGIKIQHVLSENSQDKTLFSPFEELDDEKRAKIEADLNLTKDIFMQAVRSGRPNIDQAAFDGASMYMASQAIALGMADGVGTMDDVLLSLKNSVQSLNDRRMTLLDTVRKSLGLNAKNEEQASKQVQDFAEKTEQLVNKNQELAANSEEKDKQLSDLQAQLEAERKKTAQLQEERDKFAKATAAAGATPAIGKEIGDQKPKADFQRYNTVHSVYDPIEKQMIEKRK